MKSRIAWIARRVVGSDWRAILVFVSPTLGAVAYDLVLRARPISQMRALEYVNYVGSSLVACGLWGGLLWGLSLLAHREGRAARIAGRVLFALAFVVVVLPLLQLCYGGQILYYGVFRSYMTRDTLRLGMALGGTAGAWLAAWSWRIVPLALVTLGAWALLAWGVWKAGRCVKGTWPILPIVGFSVCAIVIWNDAVETRALQAASPDVCLWHSIVGVVRDGWIRGKHPLGVTVRQPRPLPALDPPQRRRNVILVITESVRADVICSEKGQAGGKSTCAAAHLDQSVPDRLGLLRATVQAPSTFSSCMMMWTGMPPDIDMRTGHEAPFLWEVARAAGYRTVYITSQNLRYQDFGAYVKVSGAETFIAGVDLGGVAQPHLGAPDERATAKMVEYVRGAKEPFFAVLHLSNTHWPYRTVPDLEPYSPHSDSPPTTSVTAYWNQYRNSALLLERTVGQMFDELRSTEAWKDTLVLFTSDHGEQFWEHGGLYHINTLFEEEVRVPCFVVAGENGLLDDERAALKANRDRRFYSQDVHATMLDALGMLGQRERMPFSEKLTGRSVLRPLGPEEPVVAMSTTTGVWADHDPVYGVMAGERKLVAPDGGAWQCYALATDRAERRPLPASACPQLLEVARRTWPGH
jgi:hypothetical protein